MASNNKARGSDESSNARRRSGEASGSGEDDVGVTSRVAGKAKGAMQDRLEKRVEKSVNDLDVLAKTLKLASQQLEGNIAAPAMEKVAAGVERIAHFVEDADARALLRRAESLARENPLPFVGVAAVIGFFGGRFLKASGHSGTSARKDSERSGVEQEKPRRPNAPSARSRSGSPREGRGNGASAGAERRA